MTARLTARWHLRHQCPGGDDCLQNPGISHWVEAVHSPGGDRHRWPLLQCPAVRAGIDAEGSPGDDEAALGRHPRGQGGGDALAVAGGGPGPHQCQAQSAGGPHWHPLLAYRLTGACDALSVVVSHGPGHAAVEVLVPQVRGANQ